MRRLGIGALLLAMSMAWAAHADDADPARVEACKRAMNERIQVCTDDCTHTALAAAPDYKDTNNNVKFGCLKNCAMRQVFQMQVCRNGGSAPSVETNQH